MNRRDRAALRALPWWLWLVAAGGYYLGMNALLAGWLAGTHFAGVQGAIQPLLWLGTGLLVLIAGQAWLNARRRRALVDRQRDLDTLRALDWREFEQLVGEAYRRQGYTIRESGLGGADGGVDLTVHKDGKTWLIQCKHYRVDRVGVRPVRELMGVVASEGAAGGIVVSTSSFTREGRQFAEQSSIQLIDGQQLLQLVRQQQEAPVSSRAVEPTLNNAPAPEPAAPPLLTPTCPTCGSAMVRRTAKRGARQGQAFWGCTQYPACRGTRPG